MDFKELAWVAFLLFLLWAVAGVVFKMEGDSIHPVLLAAVVFAVISLVQRARGTRRPHA